MTFVPLPKGQRYLAGLLTVDLPAGIRRGETFSVVARQLTGASAVGHGPFVVNPTGSDLTVKTFATRVPVSERAGRLLAWRRALGAFQINLRIGTKQALLVPEEHRLALFRWISENTLPESRWFPVLRRYVSQLAGRVGGFGGDPNQILPSPSGSIPGHPGQPGRPEPAHPRLRRVTGKVHGLSFDHFGDFDGFVLETEDGELAHFRSREDQVLQLLRDAMEDRIWVTVVREHEDREDVRELIIGP